MSDADHDRRKREAAYMQRILNERYYADHALTVVPAVHHVNDAGPHVMRNPDTPPAVLRPVRGYIQHFSRIPEGGRWPEIVMRVIGSHPDFQRFDALLRLDGSWHWDASPCPVPDECNFTQGQLGDAIAAAGIKTRIRFAERDWAPTMVAIEYVDVPTRPAQAKAEEWTPKAPKWRGGKAWR